MSNTVTTPASPNLRNENTVFPTDAVAVIGRVLIAVLFLLSGASKLANHDATIQMIRAVGLPFPLLAYLGAVAVEIGASIALILGYRTKAIAAIMAVFTIAAAFAFHAHFGDQDQFTHFFKNISIVGGLLQIVAFGGGRFSIDGRGR